ncbi:alpha/beta-hydrolase [Wolfiporia cocos MD-104 SS10]|uniref:Alpha/beta-hydrolase n=1 Tax=Wolfiporia cocos (strain MD-104) TaxID=742152 RepID=A0A2H3IVJ3_WOLCO|nr:alpha/beta-hydrolase [Wolfiporia cocos MD-104 SS10]
MGIAAELTPAPLVIVEGFLGGGGEVVWGNFQEHSNYACRLDGKEDRKIIFASVGPVSSLHDRACELFYALRGGTVDYGEEHSKLHGHDRYGRTHTSGLYPEWSERMPLHFLGHSLGGPTILKLQHLIRTDFFGSGLDPGMILSLNAVSAPFRGTQSVYILGEDTENAPSVRPWSVGSVLAGLAHTLSYLSPVLPDALDMHAEARHLSFRKCSPLGLLRHLWHSEWATGEDAAPYDVTFGAADARERDKDGMVHPATFYQSYVACMTERSDDASNTHLPSLQYLAILPPLYLISRAMGAIDQEAYWANDGVVPVFSQCHPYDCGVVECKHMTLPLEDADGEDDKLETSEQPVEGVWYVKHVEAATHISIVPFWLGTASQRIFWRDLGDWLWSIDRKRHKVN